MTVTHGNALAVLTSTKAGQTVPTMIFASRGQRQSLRDKLSGNRTLVMNRSGPTTGRARSVPKRAANLGS
jgi:hypothetical protein